METDRQTLQDRLDRDRLDRDRNGYIITWMSHPEMVVYYTSPKSFLITFFQFVGLITLGTLVNYDWLVYYDTEGEMLYIIIGDIH